MSLSSTSTASGRGSGRRPARIATAVAVAVAVLAPLAVLCAQVWSSASASGSFTADERRGADYLQPLTVLLAATTEAQSAAVRGRPVDAEGVRDALAAVDRADTRLGGPLGTTDRWISARATVTDRVGRTGWPQPSVAYTQYSDLNTQLMELNRTVGDNSRLILDPAIDGYYVMNASLLRIPEILVDSGRYADLSVLTATGGTPDPAAQAQLAAARNRIATDATDLSDGLLKAFAMTRSATLGSGLTRQLDNFRTAVDAVAPSTSLLAPPPQRSPTDLAADQDTLQRAALDLQRATLGQLDALLAIRAGDATRTKLVALVAAGIGVLVAVGLATLVWRRFPPVAGRVSRHAQPEPGSRPAEPEPGPGRRHAEPDPVETRHRSVDDTAVPAPAERSGGARAAR
ncbi:MAG TPA: hypothetical protein VGP36_15420 [Mycobacteriales bacterium]|jgi:hypothetical protein|nr:hypothetical protein [Mycobacteriales bacterium]